jgi:hypothetical protein
MMKWSFKDTMEIHFTVKAGDNAIKIVFGGGNEQTDEESWLYLRDFINLGDDVKKVLPNPVQQGGGGRQEALGGWHRGIWSPVPPLEPADRSER